MHCESCNAQISHQMRGAIKKNVCPFCGHEIMNSLKAEQYSNLVDILDLTDFTNSKEIDIQIREKVANLIINHFVFKKLENLPKTPDVIPVTKDLKVVQDNSIDKDSISNKAEMKTTVFEKTSQETHPIEKFSSPDDELGNEKQFNNLNTTSARSLKSSKNKSKPKTKLPALYQGIDEEASLDDSSYDTQGLTVEELKRFFPSLSQNELEEMLSKDTTSRKTSEGNGIRRLNQ